MVQYKYDAWGNHAALYWNKVNDKEQYSEVDVAAFDENYAQNKTLAELNPFRYRGYYYDTETGLYYLKTRYYDPEIGRFITIDDLSYLDPDTINGLNLYAYCGNNPVMNVDPNGKFIISFFAGLIISFAVGFTVSAVSQGIQYGWNNINYWQASVDGLFAVASTALAATGIGTGLSIVIGMGMSFGQYAIDSAFHGESLTWQGAIFAIALGGFFSGAGATNAKVLAKGITGKAVTGMKAVITTVIKYGKNSVQYKKIMNLAIP